MQCKFYLQNISYLLRSITSQSIEFASTTCEQGKNTFKSERVTVAQALLFEHARSKINVLQKSLSAYTVLCS